MLVEILSILQYLNIDSLHIEEASYEEVSDDIAILRQQREGMEVLRRRVD